MAIKTMCVCVCSCIEDLDRYVTDTVGTVKILMLKTRSHTFFDWISETCRYMGLLIF